MEQVEELKLAPNVAVTVVPWSARVYDTQYGTRLKLIVKHAGQERVLWLPVDVANDLRDLGVLKLEKWSDSGKLKPTVVQGAKAIRVCKVQKPGDKNSEIFVEMDDSSPVQDPITEAQDEHTSPLIPTGDFRSLCIKFDECWAHSVKLVATGDSLDVIYKVAFTLFKERMDRGL